VRENVGLILEAGAHAHPDRTLFCFYAGHESRRERYSYGSFLLRVNYVARSLIELGVATGEPTLLVYPPGLEMAVAFFACVRIGAIPVPAPPPSQAKQHAGWGRLAHIARHAGATHVLATADVAARVTNGQAKAEDASLAAALASLRWIATDAMQGESDSFDQRPSEILFVQYTSGSTNAPRGVAVSHRNVVHNAGLCVDHEQPVGVSWLPHFHDMGLLGYFLFGVIKAGESHCFSPLDFLRRPILWFDLISRMRATVTTAPNVAFEYCLRDDKISEAQLAGIDLGSLRSMVNCAEPVRAGTLERFWRRFCPYGLRKNALVAGYGLAEHTLCVTTGGTRVTSRDASGAPGSARPRRFVSCGKPAADVDLRIVDPDTRLPVPLGGIGEVWVDSPSKGVGYWRLPDLSEEQFRAKIVGDQGGRMYLRTGDVGFLKDDELYVCGRLRDMLVLNGRNVFPADVEGLLEERFARQLEGRVAAFGTQASEAGSEQLVILVEGGADGPNLKYLRSVIQHDCGVSVSAVARVPRSTIVRTSSGKVARRLCRQKWEAGEIHPLEIIGAMDHDAGSTVEDLIEELVAQAEALGDPNATLDQIGLDSIALVNFSLALESLLQKAGIASSDLMEKAADLSLLQALRVSDLRAALHVFRSGAEGAEAVLGLLDATAHELRQEERDRMSTDAALPLPPANPGAAAAEGILITGATGFLGGFLLKALVELTDDPVTVLVRCRDPAHGVSRVRGALIDSDMPPATVSKALNTRIRVVAGDLALPHFGLGEADWRTLTRSIARVYHCAAEVDYVKSYALLRAANVLATREIIAFAAKGRRKSLHYVSTTFIFGWSVKALLLEADDNPGMENLDFGYAQSKWVAEQLVRRAQRHGLPATIYRPSLVTASAAGRFVRRDITVRILSYMIRHGLTVDAPNQVSFLPVDICAHNIVALSGAPATAAPVLHMTADDHHTIAEICAAIARRFGYRFATIGLEDFIAHAHAHCRPDDDLYPLLSFFDRNTKRILRMGKKRYDSCDYRRARDHDRLALAHPTLDETVGSIVTYLQREGLVPFAPRRSRGREGEAAAGVFA
jgi:thioester reductase-like protein